LQWTQVSESRPAKTSADRTYSASCGGSGPGLTEANLDNTEFLKIQTPADRFSWRLPRDLARPRIPEI
jgi:hypothetical protein